MSMPLEQANFHSLMSILSSIITVAHGGGSIIICWDSVDCTMLCRMLSESCIVIRDR